MTDVFEAIVEDGGAPAVEKIIDGYSGFLFYDKEGKSLVVMNWQYRFNNMVKSTTTFTESKCRTSCLMCADIRTVAIRRKQA